MDARFLGYTHVEAFLLEQRNEQGHPICVGSGFCCKTAACPYGEWDAIKHQCVFLELKEAEEKYKVYECARYDYIKEQPGSWLSPAFGQGCCKSMFNEAREQILRFKPR